MVILGRIHAPFGVQGWVHVQVYGDDPAAWTKIRRWWLAESETLPDEAWQARALSACRTHGDGLVARFEGIEDRDTAGQLRGQYVGLPREALPETAADEFYWADLIGLEVVNQAGESLGQVVELLRTGAHEVLALRDTDGRKRLLPFVAAVIQDVDLNGRVIRVEWEADW